MAPLAVSPQLFEQAPAPQRRRWVLAAATTGMVLVAPGWYARSEAVSERSDDLLASFEPAPSRALVGHGRELLLPDPLGAGPLLAADPTFVAASAAAPKLTSLAAVSGSGAQARTDRSQ